MYLWPFCCGNTLHTKTCSLYSPAGWTLGFVSSQQFGSDTSKSHLGATLLFPHSSNTDIEANFSPANSTLFSPENHFIPGGVMMSPNELSPEFNHIHRSLITFDLSPLCRYWLRLHCDRVPAEYLLHRHPGLGRLLPVPGRVGKPLVHFFGPLQQLLLKYGLLWIKNPIIWFLPPYVSGIAAQYFRSYKMQGFAF